MKQNVKGRGSAPDAAFVKFGFEHAGGRPAQRHLAGRVSGLVARVADSHSRLWKDVGAASPVCADRAQREPRLSLTWRLR